MIPCIFIDQGKAVKWFDNREVIADDVPELAERYTSHGADELLILDLSSNKEGHEEAVSLMRQIGDALHIPMTAGGNLNGIDDVRRILETGAKRAVLNFSKPSAVKMIEEVSRKVGKEKITVSLKDFDALFKHQHLIEKYSTDILFMHRLDLPSIMNVTDIPSVVLTDTMEESEILNILKCPGIKGVSGKYISQVDFDLRNFKTQVKSSEQDGGTFGVDRLFGNNHDNETNALQLFERMRKGIVEQKNNPEADSYTNYLFDKGIDKILKKVGEEAAELLIAAKNPNPQEMRHELADLLYHVMVLMVERGITWEDIVEELSKR